MPVATRVFPFIAVAMIANAPAQAEVLSVYYVSSVTVTDLGTLNGGAHSDANDINDSGTIVGWSYTVGGIDHAFVFSGGAMTNIGAAFGWSVSSEARALNNSNVVVGYRFSGNNRRQAFSWTSGGGVVELADSYPPYFWWTLPMEMDSSAEAISDSGVIAGWRCPPDAYPQDLYATVWQDPYSYFFDLEPRQFGSWTYPTDINADGYVVGSGNGSRRLQYTPGVFPSPRVTIPFIAGGSGSTPRGINRWGGIVGYGDCAAAPCNGAFHAFYWDGVSANARDLGLLPTGTRSVAEDVNDAGFIAGYADRYVTNPVGANNTPYSGFLFHSDFGMFELPKLPSTLPGGKCHARALNNLDGNKRIQIVGSCETGGSNAPIHAVRWDVNLRMRRPFGPKLP